MPKKAFWTNEYWLLLLQLYLQKPVGIKPLYSRGLVNLSLELHIAPQTLFNHMASIANLDTPHLERLLEEYANNPKKLARSVALFRAMNGFNNAADFYEGVEINETFEKFYRPLEEDERLTPLTLTVILDLYFRLTPITMVADTPEIVELAKFTKIPAALVAEVLTTFLYCDPYLNKKGGESKRLFAPCAEVWSRYGNGSLEDLHSQAELLKEYFC